MLFLLTFFLGCSADVAVARSCAIPALASSPPVIVEPLPPPSVALVVTAYTSSKSETDKSPCIAARKSNICKRFTKGEKLCASNRYPIGTVLAIENHGECTVADRTNRRHRDRVDLYFGHNRKAAKKFGRQKLLVTVVSSP
ncbi:MAG: 3D domain-containing protein [Candidatus Uhrbacteria bacterium]|nr:3D domain-containing protein [Candidatus Uhrbacteria bacterium]